MSASSAQGESPLPEQLPIERDPIQWALQENNQDWYRELVEHSRDLLCVHDLRGRLLSVNPVPARLLGYSVEEMLQIPMREMIVPEYRDLFDLYLKQIERDGEAEGLMVVLSRSEERQVWEFHNTLHTARIGPPVVLGLAHDITEKRKAEAQFQALLEAAPDAMVVADAEARMMLVNAQVERMFGYQREELLGRRIEMLVPERLRDRHCELRNDFLRAPHDMVTRVGREFLALHKDGHEFPVEINLSPLQTAEGLLVTSAIRDITERKRAEEALRTSEREQHKIAEQLETERARLIEAQAVAKVGSWESELPSLDTTWSEQTHRIFETDPSYFHPRRPDFVERVHPEDRAKVDAAFEASLEKGAPSTVEYRIVMADGRVKVLEEHWKVFHDGQGRPARLTGTCQDITERKQAEENLRHSEKLYRSVVTAMAEGVLLRDAEGKILACNQSFERLVGMTREQLVGTTAANWEHLTIHEDGARFPGVTQPSEVALRTGKPQSNVRMGIRKPDGSLSWASINAQPMLRSAESKPYAVLSTFTDITEQKQADEALQRRAAELREAQRVARMGGWRVDVASGEVAWSEELYRMIGLDGSQKVSSFSGLQGMLTRDSWEVLQKAFRQVVDTREPGHGIEVEFRRSDGTTGWVILRGAVDCDASGQVTGLHGGALDITERKLAEARLREVVEELRQVKDKLEEEKFYLEQEIDTELGFDEIVGQSTAMKTVMEQVGKVAASDATVLLLGETGTGKELVARALHRRSQRAGNSFIKMNCAAIPSGLLESELFGYEKGAFTGAVSKKLGRLELADKGTLFLDEIGEISLALQPKLLRVLQDQEFERLGGTQTLKVDFRLIAATNRDLAESVKKHEFRSDLYYRLNVFPVRVPPLRERCEDIRPLVEHFVQKFAKRMNKAIMSIPKKTIDTLMQWEWPGNVRELENFIERSVILTHGSVLVSPLSELTPPSESAMSDTLEAAEREHILRALRESRGKIGGPRGAAARLGLKRTTLQSKLKQMGIDRRPPMVGH